MIGTIKKETFTNNSSQKAIVTVYTDHAIIQDWTEYTKVEVQEPGTGEVEFSIYWLVPEGTYKVEIDFDSSTDSDDYIEEIDPDDPDIGPGATYALNNGDPI